MIDDSTQYIARISYGKDSLKMLDVIHSRGLPLDRITTTEVWATDTISANLPPMQDFKERMDQWIWDRYRIEVEHLCAVNPDGSKRTYEQMFYHVPKRKNKVSLDGKPLGFPIVGGPWCQSALKKSRQDAVGVRINGFPDMISPWCRKMKIDKVKTPGFVADTVEYIGIAADEPKRFGQLSDTKRAPLVEFGIEEELCWLYCKHEGILSPAYDIGFRDGCWFCHNQGIDQLRNLWAKYPDLWQILLKWDKDSPVSFKADGHTVRDFDKRFRLEAEGLVPSGRGFRWAMLEKPPKFVAWEAEQISLFWRDNG